MDICLLCLKSRSNFDCVIKVESQEWATQDMENLIEKHFWSLQNIVPHAWICLPCWNTVSDFHNFYSSIKDAHSSFKAIVKTEIIPDPEAEEFRNSSAADKDSQNKYQDEQETSMDEENFGIDPIVKLETEEPIIDDEEAKIALNSRWDIKKDPLEKESTFNEENSDNSLDNENEMSNKPEDEAESITNAKHQKDIQRNSDSSSGHRTRNPKPYARHGTKNKNCDEFVASNFQLECGICQIKMATFYEVLKHSELEHKQQGFVICCKRKFFKRGMLVEHIKWHLDPEYCKCHECGKVMSDRRCLSQHAKVHEKPEKIHFCDECGKAFAGAHLLQRHKLIHMPEEEKKFSCDECGKNFGDNHLLLYHIRCVHLNKYALVCAICGQSMRSKESFERHMRKHEGLSPPSFCCEVCGLKMTSARNLKRHRDAQHPDGGRVEHKCEVCGRISPNLRAHKKHVKYQHEMGADFKCAMCDKAFKRSTSLKEHMATHTGTALYTCPHCPKTFNSNSNMHNHRKKMHPQEWEEACRAKYSGNLPPNFKAAA